MQPSPSAQSIGSQKPSTAASTASGKRTRTIIVARTLPEPSIASSSSNRNSTSNSSSTATPSSSQSRLPGSTHGSRDAKPKLNAYAALGSEADLELYERFLSEKKAAHGDPTHTGLDGTTSPNFLKNSPKRRTITQLLSPSDGGGRGGGGGGGPTSVAAVGMLEQTAADAKQRREAVVQHRKWLKSLPIHERLAYERQQNVITKWKTVNAQWEAFKQRTAKKLGKPEAQLVMSRAAEYREQMELYDALQRATPLSEKVAGDFWLVSLRNEGTRYVPVGNIFSGLFCPIRESSKLQPRVRRPLDYVGVAARPEGDGDDDVGEAATARRHGKALSTIEKRSLEALERKKRRLKKQLEALYPHEVEPSQSGQLKVDTVDLFEWASMGRHGHTEHDNDLRRPSSHHGTASTRSLLLTLEEENDENHGDAMNSHRSTTRSRHSARPRKGPSLRVFARDAVDDDQSPDHEHDLQAHPLLQQEHLELTFFVDVGVLQQCTLVVENNGTTALQFAWRREPFVDATLAPLLTQHDPSPLSEPERLAWTAISQRDGVVLPGETLAFVFSFRAQRAGVWLERWLLDVDPPLPGLSRNEAAAVVRVQSTAVDNFVPVLQRRTLRMRTTANETTFMAEQMLKRDVIDRVDPRYAIAFPPLSEPAQRFYEAHRRGVFVNVQYSPTLMAQCHALYADALAVVTPPAVASDDLDVTASPRTPPTSAREPVTMETTETPSDLAPYPLEWDLQLATLKDLAIAADAMLLTEFTALKNQLVAERGSQDDEDEEEEDDEEDLMEKVLGTKALKKAAEETALRALEPRFLDAFQSVTLAAHISPYEPDLLNETLATKLAAMASEAAVVVEIAQMMDTSEPGANDACALLRPLLVRALDEAFAVDRDRERVFEDAKRRFQSVALDEKTDYRNLPRLLADTSTPGNAGSAVVLFLLVDLDIANWFTLTASAPNGPLEWRLSQKLLDHDTHVPPKLAAAATSIRTLLAAVATANDRAPTIVLVSELSSPPMTKAMKRLEMTVAKARAVAACGTGGDIDGASGATPTATEISAMRQQLAVARDKQLSLRGVETVLQRALGISEDMPTVEFMASLQELEAASKPLIPRPATSDASLAKPTAELKESALCVEPKPRIIMLDHLGVLARQALKKPTVSTVAATPSTPNAPAPTVEKGKAAAAPAIDKRKSTAQPGPPPTPKQPTAEVPVEDDTDLIDIVPGMSLEMMAAQALGQRLGRVGRFLVADYFPQSWWETAFVYFAAPPAPALAASVGEESEGGEEGATADTPQPRHLLVGPQLLETFGTWQSLLQLRLTRSDRPVTTPMRAVVGGRGLERKLRLIDGLLERVDTIYFVGELAASIYRVLHTKQRIKTIKRERKPVPHYESQSLIAAVERLMQKAYRKQVELLLPFDFVVGESPLEMDGEAAIAEDEGDDDEDEDADADEDEEDDDEEEDDDAARKKKSKKKQAQKPLVEPAEVDTWRPRGTYEAERGVVQIEASGWIRFTDVMSDMLSTAIVVEGKPSLLDAPDGEADDPPTSVIPSIHTIPELDWTRRVFDVGPRSTQILLEELRSLRDDQSGWLFMNGTLGVVEYREFDVATRQVVGFLQSADIAEKSVLVAGKSTCRWLEVLSLTTSKTLASHTPVVSSRAAKLEAVLSYVVESKPHAMLTAFDSST